MNNNFAIERYSSEFIKRGLSLAGQVKSKKKDLHFNPSTKDSYEKLLAIGVEYLKQKKYHDAQEYLHKAEKETNDKTEIYFYIALNYILLKDYWEATNKLDRAMEENNEYLKIWNDTLPNIYKANLHQIIQIEHVSQYISHGLIFSHLDGLIESIDMYVGHIQESKQYIEWLLDDCKLLVCDIYEITKEEYDNDSLLEIDKYYQTAINSIDKTIEDFYSHLKDYEFFINIGLAFSIEKDYLRAIRFYTAALKFRVNMSNAYSNRSSALAAIGDYEGAQEDMEMAIKLMNS